MSEPGEPAAPLVRAWPAAQAYTLLAADDPPTLDAARWVQLARTFLAARIEPVQRIVDAAGRLPAWARLEWDVSAGSSADGASTRVVLITVPLEQAPEALSAAQVGVRAIGGAGFDVLVARARRVWQVRDAVPRGGDARAPLVLAAVASMALSAPIVPPEGGTVFGVKTARARLESRGWPDGVAR